MAYTVKPPEGVVPEDNWKNTPYTFYITVPKINSDTNTAVNVYESAGTYTWKQLKEQKTQLQLAIDDVNAKMQLIEDEQPSGTVIP